MIGGTPVWSHRRGRPPKPLERSHFLEAAWELVRAAAGDDGGTDPALVAVDRRLTADVYWKAVREVVPVSEVRTRLESVGAWFRWSGSERGLVGAAAAVAWPGSHPTWELISYRERARWGTARTVDPRSVRAVQRKFPHLFLCFDGRTRRLLVAPHTPCPILFGLRSTDPDSPGRALSGVRSEPVERWLTFRTNQGTGDHLVPRTASDWEELTSGVLRGRVATTPAVLRGGHVRFDLNTRSNEPIPCVAFEPTKTLPEVARTLVPGDAVRVWGSRAPEGSIHLEGIEVVRWNPYRTRPAAPPCPTCRRPAHSVGAGRGFRCRKCGRRFPPEAARRVPRPPPLSARVYHPTPSARRHLAPRGPENSD